MKLWIISCALSLLIGSGFIITLALNPKLLLVIFGFVVCIILLGAITVAIHDCLEAHYSQKEK